MRWPFRRPWTQRMLVSIERRIDAPLVMVPPGMLTPEVARLLFGCERMRRFLRLHQYLRTRAAR